VPSQPAPLLPIKLELLVVQLHVFEIFWTPKPTVLRATLEPFLDSADLTSFDFDILPGSSSLEDVTLRLGLSEKSQE
jgi:hypothetical protein